MDAVECIKTRRSIRKFRPEPVPREVLLEIVTIAKWSPSYKNSQPWEAVIISGPKKEALTNMLIGLLNAGTKPSPDLPEPESWPEAEASRIRHLLKKRSEVSGIDLSDPAMVRKAKEANFSFYGAPHALYLFQEASLTLWSLFDMGLFAQSLMLAAHANGVGTVPQAFVTDYAQDVKKFLSIPRTKRLILGLSIGYPDMESPVNAFRTDRIETDEIVKWIE
ncbi:MAG: nitroreductase [Deltaproteobacteria bacterium]